MKPIAEGWKTLVEIQGKKSLTPRTMAVMRTTFFCGAEWLWHKLKDSKDPALFRAVSDELEQFAKEFDDE